MDGGFAGNETPPPFAVLIGNIVLYRLSYAMDRRMERGAMAPQGLVRLNSLNEGPITLLERRCRRALDPGAQEGRTGHGFASFRKVHSYAALKEAIAFQSQSLVLKNCFGLLLCCPFDHGQDE
jgi:hypothetical protein